MLIKENLSDDDQALGTYQEDPANSGEFPAFVKDNKHLYFLKVFYTCLIANLQTAFCRIHFTTLRDGPYQTTSAVWDELADMKLKADRKLGLKLRLDLQSGKAQVGSVTNVDSAACAEKAGRDTRCQLKKD